MRSKEDADDYRYFPEPDLLPLIVSPEEIESIRKSLPELPAQRRSRFIETFGLQENAAEVLTSSRKLADYFEATLAGCSDARQVSNWIMVDIMRIIKELKIEPDQLHITPARLGALLKLIDNGTISAKSARKVVDLIQERNTDPDQIIIDEGMQQLSDPNELEVVVHSILTQNHIEVERFRAGDRKLMGFFVGQAMKATKGSGNPKEINALLSKKLG
jgi:aspartyl-tRNA(Asn)/glutamyl-tRNA(Gln) amidotransferase subunit B